MKHKAVQRLMFELRRMYAMLDVHAAKAAVDMKASCTKGCIGCCYQMATATIPEAMLIADALLKRADWLEQAKRLHEASLPFMEKYANRDEYFKKAIPCAFLDVEKRECTQYENRPAACRYYMVVTPKEHCYPESEVKMVGAIDLSESEAHVWKFALQTLGEVHGRISAPLPLVVLFSMELMANSERRLQIRELEQGLLNPEEWMMKTVFEDHVGGLGEDNEQTRAIHAAAKKLRVL